MTTHEQRITKLEQDRDTLTQALATIAHTQADHTLFLARIVETLDEHTRRFNMIDDRLNQMYDEINSNALLLHEILDRLPPAKE